MDPEDRDNGPAGQQKFTRHSVRALAIQHATISREARDNGADLEQVTSEQQAELCKHMDGLTEEECRRFTRMYAEEMTQSAEKLLAEAIEQRRKQAIHDYQRGGMADRVATWLFIILVIVFVLIALKT